MAMIPSVALTSILLFRIEYLAVQLEELLSIFPVQVFCNNIYDNDHEIIGWYPKEGNNSLERGTEVTVDASGVGT